MILIPRYPRLCFGEPTDATVHAWETRPFAQDEVYDRLARAAMESRILSGLQVLSRRFWINRVKPKSKQRGMISMINPSHAAETTLLMHMDDTGLTDACGATVTINGSVARSATQSKFGGYSADFGDAVAGNYLTLPQRVGYDVGANNWTAELWFYQTATTGDQQLFHYGKPVYVGPDDISFGIVVGAALGVRGFIYVPGPFGRTVDFALPAANTWHHAHISNNGASQFFAGLNGTSSAVTTGGTPNTPTGRILMIGRFDNVVANRPIRGFIDEFKIRKGNYSYLWAASYTVPTASFFF